MSSTFPSTVVRTFPRGTVRIFPTLVVNRFPIPDWNDSDLLFWFVDTIRFSVQGKDPGVMKQPIEKGGGHHRVAHHLGPGVEALVRGDDERGLFV